MYVLVYEWSLTSLSVAHRYILTWTVSQNTDRLNYGISGIFVNVHPFGGSTDRASSQQLQIWFSEHFVVPKLAAWFVTPIVSATVEQIWREKTSEKPHSIRLLR